MSFDLKTIGTCFIEARFWCLEEVTFAVWGRGLEFRFLSLKVSASSLFEFVIDTMIVFSSDCGSKLLCTPNKHFLSSINVGK